MKKSRALILAAVVLGFGSLTQADTLDMRGTDDTSRFEQAGKPTRGMTQARVEAEYGAPAQREAAVGDPPITRWDYAEFAVFFEYDRVIHSVSKRR